MKTKTATALTISALTILLLSSCRHEDKKAGYPQYPSTEKITKTAPAAKSSQKEKHAYKPAVKPAPGPAGTLAATFCSLSIAADFKSLSQLFSAQFMIRTALPQNNTTGTSDKQIAEMAADTTQTISTDIKTSRVKPVEDCEIINIETLSCETAVLKATARYPEQINANNLKKALDKTNTTKCGFIGIREISNTGIEESHFFIGNPGGEWKLLSKVTQD